MRRDVPGATGCEQARRWIHQRLDGDAPDTNAERRLDEHLTVCAACRDAAAELAVLQGALRDLPPARFPDERLESVWRLTSRRRGVGRWLGAAAIDWRLAAAAAAVLLLAAVGAWQLGPPGRDVAVTANAETELDEAALARHADEARFVLNLTATALRRGERAADRVLADAVSPALRRTSIRWPGEASERPRRTSKGDDDV